MALNAFKPLQIDDTAYEYYARQMAARPLDPYGCTVFWYEYPQPAIEILAPPVFTYSWAVVHCFSDNPLVWKLCLLPWSLLLVFGLRGQLRRFAPQLERPLLVMLVFSPALLPSLNLMLDVPTLALALTALNLYFRAADRNSLALAAWAGLLAGLAMQTKYTAFLVPGTMLLWSATTGRWRLWPAAALVAVSLFVTWEFLVALLYEDSHFLFALSLNGGGFVSKLYMLPFLTSYLGGLAPFGIALGLAALGFARRWVWIAVGVMLAGFVVVTLFDVRYVTDTDLFGNPFKDPVEFQLGEVLFNCNSFVGIAVVILSARRLLKAEWSAGDRATLFLVLWLGLEVLGYMALTPFAAVRRVFGVGLVSSLIVGRLAARHPLLLWRRRFVPWLTAGSVALALGYGALDWHDAWVQQHAVETAADYIAAHDGGRVWYAGHWGFQFYAERRGMTPIIPAYAGGMTTFQPGDWLVLPEVEFEQQKVRLPQDRLELAHKLSIGGSVPLRTVSCFYAGRTPLEHQEGPSLIVRIYRVRIGFDARGPEKE